MYDWAISSLQTTIMVAVFPVFFVRISDLPESRATQAFAAANTIAALVLAVLSPLLGAISDFAAAKKKLLFVAMLIGATATAAMFFIDRGEVGFAATLFVIAVIAGTASVVFYEALLPHIAGPDEIDRVSTAGYAMGYIGGGVLLALNLAWIQKPEWFGLPYGPDLAEQQRTLPTRLAFVSVAVWWSLFTIPLLRGVREPARTLEADEVTRPRSVTAPFVRLAETLRELRGFKQAFLMLLAFLVYNDGIQTIIRMATAYGAEIGIPDSALIASILIVQFVGIPFTFLFGALAERVGAKHAIFLGLLAYTFISVVGYFMKNAVHFVILAGMTGMVQGGTQALSRSLFATLIPAHKSGEFFGFYSVFEKFASIFGPLLFAATIAVFGTSRHAILSVILFFAIGAWLLSKVDVAKGQQDARLAETGLKALPTPTSIGAS
ncbi:MAG: hypothetical protein MNPFHGCM_00126 [Gemmatimonadaceae bacterium]|nr:hypothetical protein [Gemmatimonadaceae bacterium]